MARNVLRGAKDGNGFENNPQNINRSGANRKSIATVNKDLEDGGYGAASKKDIIDCYLRLINLDVNKLTDMIKGEDQPALIRIVGKAILSGKGFDVIEKVLDRGIGKAEQRTDVTSGGEKISTTVVINTTPDIAKKMDGL